MLIITSCHSVTKQLIEKYLEQNVSDYCTPLIICTYGYIAAVKGVIEFSILKGRNLVPMDTNGG